MIRSIALTRRKVRKNNKVIAVAKSEAQFWPFSDLSIEIRTFPSYANRSNRQYKRVDIWYTQFQHFIGKKGKEEDRSKYSKMTEKLYQILSFSHLPIEILALLQLQNKCLH